METGDVVTCPRCDASIDDFSLADEWFCDCGEQGILEDEDTEDEGDEVGT